MKAKLKSVGPFFVFCLILIALTSSASAGINIYPSGNNNYNGHQTLYYNLEEKYVGTNGWYPKVCGANPLYLWEMDKIRTVASWVGKDVGHPDPQTWTYLKKSDNPKNTRLNSVTVGLMIPTTYCFLSAVHEDPVGLALSMNIKNGLTGIYNLFAYRFGFTPKQYSLGVDYGRYRLDKYNKIYITTSSWVKR